VAQVISRVNLHCALDGLRQGRLTDPKLIDQAVKVGGERTRNAAVTPRLA